MVLSGEAILQRLESGHIFRERTWEKAHLKEASYALRLAEDGLLIDGKFYDPGSKTFAEDYVNIEPGKIAILSTMEEFDMPCDLVGKVGIRIDHALLGLTGLMGIQVDPLYGRNHVGERLYIRVVNLGNDPIRLNVGEEIFTFEVHQVDGKVVAPPKGPTWERLKDRLRYQSNASWTYATRVDQNVTDIEGHLDRETLRIREYLQPVVLFGVFLVAVTVLGAVIALILGVRETPEVRVPRWFTSWGWVLLLVTLIAATGATAAIGVITSLHFWQTHSETKHERVGMRRDTGQSSNKG